MTILKTGPLSQAVMHHFEGCKLHAYQCPAGVWTIGYGDTGPHVHSGLVWSRHQAEMAFSARLAHEFEPGVSAAIGDAPTTPAQFGAMVCLAYNIGVGAFRKSSVCRHHVAGDHAKAAAAFMSWTKAGGRVLQGLVRRREVERALYEGRLADVQRAVI
jgi:lysozyme